MAIFFFLIQGKVNPRIPIPTVDIVGVVSNAGEKVRSFIRDVYDTYIDLVRVKKENRVLKEKLRLYRSLEREFFWLLEENRRLRDMLGLKTRWPALKACMVVGGNYFSGRDELFISFGSKEGAEVGMVVLSKDGLLGEIVEVGLLYSKVRTVFSSDFVAGVEVVPRGVVALYRGGRAGELEYVYEGEEIYPGDLVFTSGVDGRFPPGIPIGVVEYVSPGKYFKVVKVRPFSKVKDERVVGVLR